MQLYIKEGTLYKISLHDCGYKTKCVAQLPSSVVNKCQTTKL